MAFIIQLIRNHIENLCFLYTEGMHYAYNFRQLSANT